MSYSKKILELEKIKKEIENNDDLDKTIELYSDALKVYNELKNKLDEIENKFIDLSSSDE